MTTGQATEGLSDLGLWGDGDDIDAITDVEKAFGVRLDYSHASEWLTAGDVFDALLKALPPGQSDTTGTWTRFAEAISQQTGVNAAEVRPATRLLMPESKPQHARLLWVVIAVAGIAAIAGAANLLG